MSEIAATRITERGERAPTTGTPRPPWRTARLQATSESVDTLRLATAGSVDDGKSTLIGRLLYDTSRSSPTSSSTSRRSPRARRQGHLDLALLTDGLRAEREQGITIDVAHRYFATPRRRFILADTPGPRAVHAQHGHRRFDRRRAICWSTRARASSSRPVATRVAALLRGPHVVLAVNKMDLVDWSEEVFDRIVGRLRLPSRRRSGSARCGAPADGARCTATTWSRARPRLRLVREGRRCSSTSRRLGSPAEASRAKLRFPVQWVAARRRRQHGLPRLRRPAWPAASCAPGDEVVALPAGARARVVAVETLDGPLRGRAAGRCRCRCGSTDELDLGARRHARRRRRRRPCRARELEADVCWLAEAPLRAGARLAAQAHAPRPCARSSTRCVDRLDVAHAASATPRAGRRSALNDIGRVRAARLARRWPSSPTRANRVTGAFVLIDEGTQRHRRRGHGRELGVARRTHRRRRALARARRATAALAWSERMHPGAGRVGRLAELDVALDQPARGACPRPSRRTRPRRAAAARAPSRRRRRSR